MNNQRTYAAYQLISTGEYKMLDITDVCEEVVDDAGCAMTAGLATAIVDLYTNGDGASFHWGDYDDCLEQTEINKQENRR